MGGVVGRRWAISRAINSSGALHTGPVPTRHSATTYTGETRQTERGAPAGGDRGTREKRSAGPAAQKRNAAIFWEIVTGGSSGISVSSIVGMPVTKSISCGFQTLVRLKSFQPAQSTKKMGTLMSGGVRREKTA